MRVGLKFAGLSACFVFTYLSCNSYGDVYVANDNFKQAKIVTVGGMQQSEETHGITNFPKRFSVTYSKAQKPGVQAQVEMKLVFIQVPEKMQLATGAAVLIDSVSEDIQIVNITRTVQVSEKPTPSYPGEPREITSYKIFGTIIFQPELWQKMMGARTLAYRLTIDNLPYTFILTPEMLEKLRLFSRQ